MYNTNNYFSTFFGIYVQLSVYSQHLIVKVTLPSNKLEYEADFVCLG